MAYGNGIDKDRLKRMAPTGMAATSPALAALRSSCIDALGRMAEAAWPEDVLDAVPDGKGFDAILMPVQSACSRNGGLNNVWAEKMRLQAKEAVKEQWKRAQKTLYGKFKNVGAYDDPERRRPDHAPRLLNLPDGWTELLATDDVATLMKLADGCDFKKTIDLFRSLRQTDVGLTKLRADALRAMLDAVRLRFGVPEWRRDDAVIQLHLDYRCVRGGKETLQSAVAGLDAALRGKKIASATLPLTSSVARGEPIPTTFQLTSKVVKANPDRSTQKVSSLVVEIGPTRTETKIVVSRKPTAAPVTGHTCVVAEDFGYRVTSSLAVVVSDVPIPQEAVDRVAGHNGVEGARKIGKRAARTFLETHVAPPTVRTVETVQFDGTDFLDRIAMHARTIDRHRSEIDRIYNRLDRIRTEMNLMSHSEPEALILVDVPDGMCARWLRMHGRFFRLLAATVKIKTLRRAVYRTVDGLKKSWFGYVSTKKAELAEKHGAVVVAEDLDVVAVPLDDPRYKGRTFNRMMNNGSKGQYIRRSEDKLAWRGIPCIRIPSFYTSTTDTRHAKIDRKQRKGGGRVFVAAVDGKRTDADVHAAETVGRYLWLMPKMEVLEAA